MVTSCKSQLAPNPKEVLPWMLQQGVGATIAAYGGDPLRASSAAVKALAITRWTNGLRAGSRAKAQQFYERHPAAAYTDDMGLLFVHAGLDPDRPLAQGDSLWWGQSGLRHAQPSTANS